MDGCLIYVFDITASLSQDNILSPVVRSGHLRAVINFDKPTNDDLTLICYSEVPSKIEIDKWSVCFKFKISTI
jgi:hypothetical protein